jgi:adenylate cyclase
VETSAPRTYPITTYRVVDLKTDLASVRRAIRAELPHLKLDVEPELMSDEERGKASAALRAALDELASGSGKSG